MNIVDGLGWTAGLIAVCCLGVLVVGAIERSAFWLMGRSRRHGRRDIY